MRTLSLVLTAALSLLAAGAAPAQTAGPKAGPAMGPLRESLFAWMARSSASTMEFLSLPAPRVVELGDQIEI